MEEIFRGFQTIIDSISNYIHQLAAQPVLLFMLIIDIIIVCFIFIKLYNILKNTRASQLIKGVLMVVVAYYLTQPLGLNISHTILGLVMQYRIFPYYCCFPTRT